MLPRQLNKLSISITTNENWFKFKRLYFSNICIYKLIPVAFSLVIALSLTTGCAYVFYSVPDMKNKSVAELHKIIQSHDDTPRGRATRRKAIEEFKTSARIKNLSKVESRETIVVLLSLFGRNEGRFRFGQAIYNTLKHYPEYTPIILPKLIKLWENSSNRLRGRDLFLAIRKLSSPKYPQALSIFVNEIPSGTYRYLATGGIAKIGPAGKNSAPKLLEMMKNYHPGDKAAAATALWKVTGEIKRPLDALIAVLRMGNQQEFARATGLATNTVFQMGESAKPASPILQKMMRSEDGYCPGYTEAFVYHIDKICQEKAAVVLWRIDPSQRTVVKQLIEKGIETNSLIYFFCRMGDEVEEFVPLIIKQYEISKGSQRRELASLLEHLLGKPYPETWYFPVCR